MRRDRTGSAIAARDAGLRRVTRLTWQVAAAGAAGAALIAAAFGHGVSQHNASQHANSQTTQSHRSGASTGSGAGGGSHRPKHHGSGLVIPAQPPAPANGAGQVTSGGS